MASPNIRINIASEFKDRGFKRASRATTGLERQFKSLGRTVIAVFSARQIIRFTQESVRAFAAEDRAVRALSGTLDNLGLAFQGANVESFVSEMQRVTAVSDDQLRPALQQLATTTLNVQEAQKLLGLALDISAGTGKDLSTIVNGLSRAYLRDVSALARLNIGLTAAQLSTMSFAEAQAALTERFSGQAAIAADSYQGKISKLGIAFDEAQEIIGQKFIKSLENMADGNFDKVIETIGNAAVMVGNGFIRASYGVQKLKAALGGNFDQVKKLQEAMNLELAGGFGVRGRVPAAQLQRQSQQQSTILRRLENERKKAAAAENKRIREQQSLRRAGTVFDMENIQIVAALQNQVTEDQRLRLTALLALNNGNAEAADKLSRALLATQAPALANLGILMTASDNATTVIAKIVEAQTRLFLLNTGITNTPKAPNPFEGWKDVMSAILSDIDKISAAINAIPKYNPTGNNFTSGTGTTTAPNGGTAWNFLSNEHASAAADAAAAIVSGGNGGAPIVDEQTQRAIMDNLSNMISVPDVSGWRAFESGDVIVNVTVGGNVTAENDLIEAVVEAIYDAQKSGRYANWADTVL